MEILDRKSEEELLRSLLAEIAKARNELRCAEGDIAKATNRIAFAVAVSNELIKRQEMKR